MAPTAVMRFPLLSPQELDENEAKKKKLYELVASKQLILFVGSGSSASLGYPVWSHLLQSLETVAVNCQNRFHVSDTERVSEPLSYADKIRQHIKDSTGNTDQFYAKIRELFKPNGRPTKELHRLLISLPCKGIVTTNYDLVLELAVSEVSPEKVKTGYDPLSRTVITDHTPPSELSDFFLSLDDETLPRRIFHLHGIYDDTDSIILGKSDYLRKYGFDIYDNATTEKPPTWTMHRKVLWSLLATRRLLFVGFSLEDPYLKFLLSSVNNDLWRWNKPQHFAIVPIEEKSLVATKSWAKHLQAEHMVEVIYYENYPDAPHENLKHIVSEMANSIGIHSASDWIESVNRRMRSG